MDGMARRHVSSVCPFPVTLFALSRVVFAFTEFVVFDHGVWHRPSLLVSRAWGDRGVRCWDFPKGQPARFHFRTVSYCILARWSCVCSFSPRSFFPHSFP